MATLTKRHAAFHTPCRLYPQSFANLLKIVDLIPIVHSVLNWPISSRLPFVLHESSKNKTLLYISRIKLCQFKIDTSDLNYILLTWSPKEFKEYTLPYLVQLMLFYFNICNSIFDIFDLCVYRLGASIRYRFCLFAFFHLLQRPLILIRKYLQRNWNVNVTR